MIGHSNQRTEASVNERRVQLDSLVATLDIRTEDLEQRLSRFSGLLDESLEAASARAREVARVVSEASAEGMRAISEQYERARVPKKKASVHPKPCGRFTRKPPATLSRISARRMSALPKPCKA